MHGTKRGVVGALGILIVVPVVVAVIAALPVGATDESVGEFCYVVADKTPQGDNDLLTRIDTGVFSPATNETNVGYIGTVSLEAIAMQPKTDPPVLFASDRGMLGTLDTQTAAFRPIGSFGTGTGPQGTIAFNDVDGLTFDPTTGQLYGTVRRSAADLLIEINPRTGAHVPDVFNGHDYVAIQPIKGLDDIDDISVGGRAIDIVGNRFPLWAIANEGGDHPRLIKINRVNGVFNGSVTDVGPTVVEDIEGLSWGNLGLWATSGKASDIEGLWAVNPDTGLAANPRVLDNASDYESIACPPPASLEVLVGPATALNRVDGQHTFTVTVLKAGQPASGVRPDIELTGVGSIVSNGCAAGTASDGTCTVRTSSAVAGTSFLRATVTANVGQGQTATETDQQAARWVGLDIGTACRTIPQGGLVSYAVSFEIGERMNDLTITSALPGELVFWSAGPIAGVTPATPAFNQGGAVSWTFPSIAAGRYTATIDARIRLDVPNDTSIVSPLTFSHGGVTLDRSHTVTAGLAGLALCPLPLELTVTPDLGLNLLQDEHVFTVEVERDGKPAVNVVPSIDLITTGTITDNTCAAGTSAAGTCTVTVNSGLPGTGIMTASYSFPVADRQVTATDLGTKVWVALDLGAVCLVAPQGALVPYEVSFEVGHDLTDVTVTDHLPDEMVFWSAEPINGIAPVTPAFNTAGGTVSWFFDRLPAGRYTARVLARVDLDVPLEETIVNTVRFSYGGHSVERSHEVSLLPTLPLEPCPLPVQIDVLPKLGLNLLEDEHTFTVTVKQDGAPAVGVVPTIDLLSTGTIVGDTCATGTDQAGRCTVTLDSPLPGTGVLRATYGFDVGEGRVSATDVGTIVWVGLDLGLLCDLDEVPVTTPLPYTVAFEVGETLRDVVVTHRLPDETLFVNAEAIGGVVPATPGLGQAGGEVRWEFDELPPGRYTALVSVVVGGGALPGSDIENTLEFRYGGLSVEREHRLRVIEPESVLDALAVGVDAHLPGGSIPGRPTTRDADSDALAVVPNPLPGATGPLVRAVHVSESEQIEPDGVTATALTTTGAVDLNIPGVVRVRADSIVARATSAASLRDAVSTAAGSTVANLRVNGQQLGDVSEPTTLAIRDPLTGRRLAEVHVMQRIADGAAAGEEQPSDGMFTSALTINALRVVVHDRPGTPANEAADVIIGQTQSTAGFLAGVGCLEDLPLVSGLAVIADLVNVSPEVPRAILGDVLLPRTGGAESEHLTDLDLAIGTIDSGLASTDGVATTDPRDTEAHSHARLSDVSLLDGGIRAALIEARADADGAGTTGETVIGRLSIAGTQLCPATCRPAANTRAVALDGLLILLNEQIAGPEGITVNAVHIFARGDNALGLPAGAEIVLGSAHAGIDQTR